MLLQQLLNGLTLGATYSLIAIGYTLVFGVLNLINLAHGEVFMFGAFMGLQLVLLFRFNILVAVLGSMVGTAFLGMVIELIGFRPLRWKGHFLAPIISTVAISIILQDLAVKIFGAELVGFPETVKVANYHLGNITVSSIQLIIIIISLVLMVCLSIFIKRTKLGMAMRAAAEDMRTTTLMGVNVSRVITLTFAVSSALAGAAGVLVGLFYHAINPFMGFSMGLKGLVVMLLGGLGNIFGAMVGGLILGLIEVMTVAYLASSYRDAFAFAVMILVLLIRPQGLFGKHLNR